jgi:hypothetical protein
MTTRKPTDEEFDKIIAESPLNRREKRLLKFKRKAMQEVMTHNNRPNLQSLAGTNTVTELSSKAR